MSASKWTALLLAGPHSHGHALDPHDAASLGERLDEIWREARETWPSVAVGEEAYVAHLARHLPSDVPVVEALRQMNTADLYLACACSQGNAQAIDAFETHCLSVVDGAIARFRLGADAVAEVKQRLRQRVLVADDGPPRIVGFSGRGELRGWVRVMAVREALHMSEGARRETELDDADRLQAFVTPSDPELDLMKARYRDAFGKAFDRALRELPAREQTLLRQHVIDGLTIDQLGALYRVHRATAARSLERVRKAVLASTRAHMSEHLHVRSSELNSILRLIRSRLEVTLRGLFGRR